MCTTDECDPQSGECKNTSKNCDDGNLCTTDSCDPQTGICQNISKCDDNNDCTIDHCDPGTGRCQHLLKSMNRCQRCVDGKIESKDCNDNDPCTSDSCDSSTGNCVHTPLKKCDKDNSDPTFIQMPVVHSNNSVPKIPYIFSPVSSPGQKDTITISYEIPMKSLVTIMIYDSDNYLVRILINDQIYNAGMASDTWDGKTDTDTLVSDGKYLFFITGINLHHSLETWSQQGEIIVDNVLPTVQIKNIQADTPQYAHYTVHGTASDAHFDQLFFECFNEYTHVYLELKEYPVINDILASFNALYVQEDTYTIRLSVYDQAGNSSFEHFDVKIQPEKSSLEIFINEVSQIPLPGSEGYVPTSDATDVWIEDQLPDGSTQIGNWKWDNEMYYSGLQSHTSDSLTNTFQHYLIHADKTLSLSDNDNIIQYIYIDSLNQPDEILMQFYTDSGNGEHRAFWGASQIPTGGRTGSASLYRMGAIPPSGKWIRLKIPAIQVGLAGKEVKGIYFASNNGKVYWDKTTKSDDFNETQKDSWMSASQMGHDDRSDTVIRYYLSEDTNISLIIYDKDNRQIKALLDNTFQNAGYHKIIWDGFDNNGLQVINDKYYFQFSAEDNLFSSNTYAVVKGQAIDIQHKQIVFDSLGNQYKIIDQRVNKFSDSDALLYTITASSLGQNQLSPTSLEIDCNDNLFILDDHHDKIYKINSNGLITLELPYDASQPWQDSQIPYRLDGMIIDDNNHLVISSQNYTETIHLVPGRGIIDISDITAKIRVPYPDSLVSYSVPVIGTASAKRFKEYIVEYGAGESPQEWTTLSTGQSEVFDDYKLLHSVSTVYGNLATWHTTQRVGTATGNESYYIPMGTYTIRLTVFDQLGNSKQDSTVVEMAHLVGRWGGSLISNDGMVKLHFPHNPISDDYDLFSITAIPLNEAPAIDDPHLIRISQIYRIKPAGYQFLKSCTFEMYYMDEQIEGIDENTLKIYRWNPIIQQWIYVYADNKPETNALSCQLSKFNDYEVYYAVMSDPPPAPILFQPDTPTKLRSVTLFGRATPGVNVEIFVNDVSKTITQADENTGLFMHAGLELSLGNNTIKAQAVDPVGNTSLFSDLISILLEDSEPDMITSISFKTSDFTIEYTDDIAIGQSLYIELNARDIDNQAVNTAMVTVRSSATDYSGISVQLLESSKNSGIYRGKVKLAEISNPYNGEIGVSPNLIEMVTAISDVNANISVSVQTVDAVPPKAPLISSPTHPSFCQNTFEVDSGEWSNMSNIYGATVQRTQVQKFSGDYAIQMTNENTGGDFANFVVATPFDARQYPILSFNYKVSQDIKLNLIAYVNGMWKEIIFTDDPKTVETFGDDLYRPIGQFENVIANGQWQHTQINLFNLLSNDAPDQASYIVEELFFSDYNLPAWMELVMGEENTKGATWYVDNFIISEGGKSNSHPVFHITPNDASVTQYSYKLDQNSGTIPDRIADCSVNDIDIQGVPDGSWYFHVRALDGGGNWGPANHYRIMIDTTGPIASSPVPADNSTSGSLEVKLMITDGTGSGVNPKTIQIQLNDVVYDMDSGALQYDDISGILTLSVWKANFDTTPWIDGESVHASLIAVEDFAGNPLSDIYNWTWKVDYSTLAGGFLSLLTTQGGNTPSWSYDGSQIAFMSERSTNQDIWVINSDDYAELNNSIIQITTHSANDHHPAFSTTDNRIAFVSDRNDNEHIYVVRSDGTGLLQLTFADTDDSHPSWSPDSSQIVFSRNNEIWVINADGSNETQITFESVEENLDPVWSPSGQRIAFTKSLYSDEVSVINSDGTDLAILTDSGRDFLPTWSKQTNQIIFVTNRDNSSAIHIMNINGSNDVLYLDNQQWWDTEPDQSPVDEKLAFQSTRNGSWNIWIKNNLEISELSSDTRLFSPNGDNINDSVSITFRLTGGITNIQLTIYDSSEKIVRTLVDNQPASVGENEIIWDGMDDDSTVVNDGSYTCTLLIAGIVGNDTIERHQNIIIDTQPPVFKDWVIPEDHFTGGEPTISVTVSDREMNNNAVVMQYAIASISGLETPDILNWSDFATGPTGNLRVKWSNYNANYLFLRSYAEDNQGNANYSDIQKVLIGSTQPKAIPQVYDLDEDNVISIILEGYDSYNTTLDFYISKQPLHGKLSGTAPELIFTPDTNYSGSDKFTFIVNNGTMNSEPADVTINILPVADMPSLSIPDILTANEDTAIPLTIVAQCTDIDGSEYLTDIQLSNIPDGAILSSGSAIGNSWFISPNQLSDLTITPPANNADDFTISVSVASAETLTSSYFSVEGQIEINVIPVADAPTMTVIEDITAVEDMPISFSIAPPQLTDIDGSEVLTSISVSGLPKDFSLTNGTVSGQSWVLTPGQLNDLFILPATNFSDSFTLTLSVGSTEIENNSQAFHIENIDMVIEPVPDAPVLSVANIITTNEDTKSALVIAVELSDHSETLGNLIITGIPSGITISGGTIIENSWIVNPEQLSAIYFIPPENDDSDFILTITASSFIENGYSATAVRNAEVIVYPVNDPPVINIIDNFSMFEDFTETIDFKIYDIDSSALTVTYQTDNENLFSDIRFDGEDENQTMKIIPSPDENGIANINISVSDGSLTVTNALSLNITPVNDSPTMSALDNMTMDEDAEAISKSFTVNDIDSEPQLIEIYTYSSNQLLIPDNNLTITGEYENYSLAILPFTNQSGIAQITVTVSDGIDQQEVYFDVIVNAVADPPSLSLVNIAYGLEGPSIPLVIAPPELMDNDGSEQLSPITVEGVPPGATLSQGTFISNTTWTLLPDQLSDLSIIPDQNNDDDFQLNVRVSAIELSGDVAVAFQTITVVTLANILPSDLLAPQTIIIGKPFETIWSVKNSGNVLTTQNWQECLYLTADSLIEPITMGCIDQENSLYPGDSYSITITRSLKIDEIPEGSYYLTVWINPDQRQSEIQTIDNQLTSPLINVVKAPNLKITQSLNNSSALAGTGIQLSYTVVNSGNKETSGLWTDCLSIVSIADPNIRQSLGCYESGRFISIDESYMYSMNINLPCLK
ncbi:MAG: hypothetical protein OMM_00580 [Candidatus Magnetoglobus multicellularis str. Araruama]|uniref:FlgD Ig-like domain-containing protein n=1 Tax=Candidatus Magnetoglobus multicellularis str. Araruama TaxID=890399 RepID=A0A1V1PGA0_9BACT|nr:MAG: hypothetical protein OMM_00580 [Candidatus Magnetoglobus multicellularis str. Araruama]